MRMQLSRPSLSQTCQSRPRRSWTSLHSLLVSTAVVLSILLPSTYAYDLSVDARASTSTHFRQLEHEGLIHFDANDPPSPPSARLELRQDSSAELSTSTTPSPDPTTSLPITASESALTTLLSSTDLSATLTSASSASSTQASVTIIPTPIPSPFDTSIGSNFSSQACPNFFTSFLADPTFKSCIPVSLLLQTSAAFFRAEQDPALIKETLDAACDAPFAMCSTYLTTLATDLTSTSNCGQDYADENPLVVRAYNGLVAYAPIYRATCLQNVQSGKYCFAEAVSSNATSRSDPYPYYTAIGLDLPAGSRPSCSLCLKQTMAIFQPYAADSTQPLSRTYTPCVEEIDAGCGASFANSTVPSTMISTSGAVVQATAPRFMSLVAVAVLLVVLLAT